MSKFDPKILKKLYIPPQNSHKGENGKLMIIAGSELFHSASLWPLTVASRIVDMVFFSSVPTNNEIVKKQKKEFRNGIIVPREKIGDYIDEADCILIGPGLPRQSGVQEGDNDTEELTTRLLKKYPKKRWIIDGGSIQTVQPELLPKDSIITPHRKEFEIIKLKVKSEKLKVKFKSSKLEEQVQLFANEFHCIVLLKGPVDIVSDGLRMIEIKGGNTGMTKGGTGDVLAGLVASLYCKNDAYLSAIAGSFINKKSGENLFKKVGYYFNASDLANEIPQVISKLI